MDNIIYCTRYDFAEVKKWKRLSKGKGVKKKITYKNAVTAFDIETSNLKQYEISIMYIWQFAIDENTVVIGRYWWEFKVFIDKIKEIIGDDTLIVLVHNLSYEWQFLKSIIPVSKVFAMSKRKILYFLSNNIEFRCTYLHSNMDLRHYLKQMKAKHQKLELDYDEVRYPWSVLGKEVIQYSINDVLGLVEAYKYQMEMDNDTLYTIPYTSTGYVRREAKKVLGGYQKYIKPMLPSYEVLQALNLSFRGGNTHGNRRYAGLILNNVHSYDIASSYPSVLATMEYPKEFKEGETDKTALYIQHGKAVLMLITFYGLRLHDENWGCPYLSQGKAIAEKNLKLDNGRVLSGDMKCWINEIDLAIINSEYDYDNVVIDKVYYASKGLLPLTFRELIKDMFKKKTLLKGGEAGSEREYLYHKYKNMINSLYGMTCQNPLKDFYTFDEDTNEVVVDTEKSYKEIYDDYLKKGWLPYQWGVWCTSYARLKLEQGLQAIPAEAFVYCDTDSIKYLGNYKDRFDELNEMYLDEEYSAVDEKGKKYYLGIYEYEGMYERFKHYGAKRYAYEEKNKEGDIELHITIAGVNKNKGAVELGTLERFEEGITFVNAGGTESKYNDEKPYHITIDEHDVEVVSNIYICDSTYTLGLAEDYRELLIYLSTHDISKSLYFDYNKYMI